MKPTWMRYGLCHTFIPLTFAGDEIDTVVGQRIHPADSTGWTAILLERASRFLVDRPCGRPGYLYHHLIECPDLRRPHRL